MLPAPLSSSGTASCSETFQSPQAQSISATYSGDSNTFTSSGEATATVTKAATSTALSSSPVSPSFGQALTYTATVLLDAPATDGPAPTGTISFTEGTAIVCADVPVSKTAPYTATCSQSYLPPGSETVTATYSGDTNTLTSSGQAVLAVSTATTSTSVSASPASPTFGQAVTLTAEVAPGAPPARGRPPAGP